MWSFETERLTIRSFKEDDWKNLYEYLSDPEVAKYESFNPYTIEQTKEAAIRRSKNESFFAVCLKDSGKLIGNIYFQKENFDTWELGYAFNSKYQGNGYATEASKSVVSKAFREWNARRVVGMCNALNIKSWRLFERLGFRREGILKKNIFFKNDENGNPIWIDTYAYGILKEEWNGI